MNQIGFQRKPCWYEGRGLKADHGGPCSWGGAVFRVHDKRLCVDVCANHAGFRATTSMGIGHSQGCPEALDDGGFKQVTRLEEP